MSSHNVGYELAKKDKTKEHDLNLINILSFTRN